MSTTNITCGMEQVINIHPSCFFFRDKLKNFFTHLNGMLKKKITFSSVKSIVVQVAA